MKEKIEILKQKINGADAIVVGTASGMSAASGLRFYYQDDDDYKQIAGGLRGNLYSFLKKDLSLISPQR